MKFLTAADIADRLQVSRATTDVAITWKPCEDDRRLRRVAVILADILDNASTPGDGGKR